MMPADNSRIVHGASPAHFMREHNGPPGAPDAPSPHNAGGMHQRARQRERGDIAAAPTHVARLRVVLPSTLHHQSILVKRQPVLIVLPPKQ